MDGVEFSAPGVCPACGMSLTPKQNAPVEPISLSPGSGMFLAAGGLGREATGIKVHYYLPQTFTPRSPVLLVIPGAGRDGDEYRDAWIESADRVGALVASLGYPEAHYDFAAYHLGGVVRDLTLPAGARDSNVVRIRDEDIVFTPNPEPDTWLFNDFDRVFGLLKRATGSDQVGYDMFGHSAGGQILHRLVLFHPHSRAQRIIAANAGFYTLPNLDLPMIVGMAGSGVSEATLAHAFSRPLTLLLGEADNGDAAGGTILHTPLVDQQGLGRLDRGRYFFAQAEQRARAMSVPLAWRLQTVPGVGHNFRAMSQAAASLLYP